ncbi:alkaline phosphatase family protein [Celerinatantimonas yamalensis]|uniref:Alkaline phosphatase family protein n=1 Tax=Celerinatantimonas yamalensis TaxID=559956 RepID=A0ABW9G4E8_9GAMM
MSRRVIYIVLDGLSHSVAHQHMGYLLALTEAQQASYYCLECELPAISRPLYECLLTGATPIESGIVNNAITRLSNQVSLFDLAKEAGKTTAAAAYHWISELYNRSPYQACRDRFTVAPDLPIQYGLFYHQDHYPDDHLFLDAEYLRRQYDPDLLLIHPMNIDDAGHKYSLDSPQYRNQARQTDRILSDWLPAWIAAGYQIIVTADHGMNNDFNHCGILPEERQVPLFVIGDAFSHDSSAKPLQRQLCGIVADLLQLEHAKARCQALLKESS